MNDPVKSVTQAEGLALGRAASPVQALPADILFDLTKQILSTPSLNERLLLALDTLTADIGYSHAAVGLIDKRTAVLRIRLAVGFPDNSAVERVELPLDSSGPAIEAIHEGRPLWIPRGSPDHVRLAGNDLIDDTDLFAIPLFGGHLGSEKSEGRFPHEGGGDEKYWNMESNCLGVLYIGADRRSLDEARLDLLTRFAELVGVAVSTAIQAERTTATIRKLQRERQWTESIMKSVADPIVLTDLDNQILLQNRRAEEVFSGSDEASEGKRRALKMNDLLFSAYLSSAIFSPEIIGRDLTLVDPLEGSDLHFEVLSTPALNSQGERIGLVSVFRDVTDLQKANEELAGNVNKLQQAESQARRERDKLDLIIENVGHPVVVCDAGGNFILFNRKAQSLFQQDGSAGEADHLFADDESPSTSRSLAAIRANSVKLTSFISALASETRMVRKAEIDLIEPETGQLLPMEITSVEVPDARGQVTAVVSVLHDLSEIRELERRRVEQHLFESEKLAAIGRLAASIAHEVNNPLEAVKNSLFLLKDQRDQASTQRFLEVAVKETERVSHIIRQMLGFARRSGGMEWVNVNQILDETLVLLEKKLQQSGIKMERQFDPEIPQIHARADQLRQVFLNLVLNAQQAIDGKGQINIHTFPFAPSMQPSICVEISDTGVGIRKEDLDRIFEPFFSTRVKGTGLGLWVTQDIVRQHGGRIEVASAKGRGTTFHVILPVNPPEKEKEKEEPRVGLPATSEGGTTQL